MGVQWHAPYEKLRPETRDMALALNSLQEELEAMDWYNQRIDVTGDEDLKGLLAHNRDEEKEHAAMLLEWIRRRDPVWDKHLKTYLFTSSDILLAEQAAEHGGEANVSTPVSTTASENDDSGFAFTVGSLRGK